MKLTPMQTITKRLTWPTLLLAGTAALQAQPDYAPAIWRQAAKNHWYNSGNGHKFVVIHDMEGYYWTTINYIQQNQTQVSIHYCVNGMKDNGSDSNPGEITQMVRESKYAWHALCWNTHSFGTEHEGFVSNPAWFTYEQYSASAGLQRHLLDAWAITPRDRNHVVGHNEKSNTAWVSWAGPNLGIDPNCNTHSDPGAFWNWPYFMALINSNAYNNSVVISVSAPGTVSPGSNFTATIVYRNTSSLNTWSNSGANPYRLGSQLPQDNTRWGFSRVDMPVSTVAPGQSVTFTLNCTAPTTPAAYDFAWQMVQDGIQWFGPIASQTITVGTPPAEIIIDNPAATFVGSWSSGTSSADKYGADYRYRSGLAGTYAQFTPNISTAGNWNVYEWHPQGGNRTTGAKIQITHTGGTTTATLNQQTGGGTWNLLGNFNFATGSAGFVRVTADHTDTANIVMADAIRFVYAP